MLNLRQIDNKFHISGGWTDVPKDAAFLKQFGFRAVLDLQHTPENFNPINAQFISGILKEHDIDYKYLLMNDGDNADPSSLFDTGEEILGEWDEQFDKRNDKILVKCGVGVSRSVAMLANYYCMRDSVTYREAIARIQVADRYNQGGLPISPASQFIEYLRKQFPEKYQDFPRR
jgi:protein-tyrosine phosphatase